MPDAAARRQRCLPELAVNARTVENCGMCLEAAEKVRRRRQRAALSQPILVPSVERLDNATAVPDSLLPKSLREPPENN